GGTSLGALLPMTSGGEPINFEDPGEDDVFGVSQSSKARRLSRRRRRARIDSMSRRRSARASEGEGAALRGAGTDPSRCVVVLSINGVLSVGRAEAVAG
ncbi:hypothetical protein ACN6LA_007028, partial [Streptomyces sp. SAS_269]|uniref:hypothetical protein n=1 Tax=Streptomyces sp. SAS_269 TaxID=3412749 RepID=UPI00403C62E1